MLNIKWFYEGVIKRESMPYKTKVIYAINGTAHDKGSW